MTATRTGVWLIGARGSVATTSLVGAAALAAGATPPTGMVTARGPFVDLALPPVESLVIGGRDIVGTPLTKRAERLAAAGVVPPHLLDVVADRLHAAEERIVTVPATPPSRPRDAVEDHVRDLETFRSRERLDEVIVVNLASTEPAPGWAEPPGDAEALTALLDADGVPCPPTVTAAVAAIRAGCAFVDFTPGAALTSPAVVGMAADHDVPVAGRDGKTGETLLKSVLAPMFADRALRVRSWAGTNLLGGGDGAQLADPANAATKLASKARSLEAILGEPVTAPVHIDCVPDLGEWKTAWNHVHFEGFLGTGMQLQFTWQGCDSSLAAPLVLDLVRLAALALRRGEGGPLPALGFFFKDPLASDEHRLAEQYRALEAWATSAA